MPPRLPLAHASRCCRTALLSPLATPSTTTDAAAPRLASLFAALSLQQTRAASILASLSDNKGAYQKRIRVGRGPSSGKGKTAGRGQKGQKARGSINPWFQGGQTPLIFKQGRKGFENHRAPEMAVVNLNKLQEWIDAGRLDASKPITPRELIQSGLSHGIKDGIKLLARGKIALTSAIDITVSRASASAIAAVEAAGGTIITRYYTRESIRRLLDGTSAHTTAPLPVGPEHVEAVLQKGRQNQKHMYRLPDPTGRWDIEYYRDPAHRGYLSHMLKEGESPSLYFKVPGEKRLVVKKARKDGEKVEEDLKLF